MTPSDLVLLIENDTVDIMTVKRAMRDLKISNPLKVAHNGEQALELLHQDLSNLPALILLDLNMPRMNGLEFLEIAKREEKLRAIPVIVFTTSNEQSDRTRAFEYSIAGYMVKPVDYERFLHMLRTVFDYWYLSELSPAIQFSPTTV